MPSIINSDDGVVSGTSGLKSTGGNDGITAFQQNGTERMRIDSSGRVGIGRTPTERLQIAQDTAVEFDMFVGSTRTLTLYGDTTQTIISTVPNLTAYIRQNDTNRVTLNTSGNVVFAGNISVGGATPTTSGTGITFPATQSASTNANTLDDYEEGTWTPVINGVTKTNGGWYVKVGGICHIGINNLDGITGIANNGAATITGLPFNIKQDSGTSNYKFGACLACSFNDESDNYKDSLLVGRINPVSPGSGASAAKIDFVNRSGVTTTTADPFNFGGSYFTDN